ncbi:hypothetical protein OM2255_04530 [Rhodobacterales bacterium HTCC2255]|nr:hypothetical protein OM2255_04530 [Rhodobacterales bacterium HTCC2255]
MKKNNKDPAIAFIPYGQWLSLNLSSLDLDKLYWPIGRPERLMNSTIGDLLSTDHLITFPRKPVFFFPRPKIKAKISIIIVEPDKIHNKYLFLAFIFNMRFYKIMTKNRNLLNQIRNGSFFYFGSTFIKNIDQVDTKKSQLASIIASSNNKLEGHKLRHLIIKKINDLDINISILGRGYNPFTHKEDGLKSFMYSIVIENIKENDYFTEKIVDSCLCNTVPIYWGAPNISDYFDIRGMIICDSLDEIMDALKEINSDDYNSREKWIHKNKLKAISHADYIKRAAEVILKS